MIRHMACDPAGRGILHTLLPRVLVLGLFSCWHSTGQVGQPVVHLLSPRSDSVSSHAVQVSVRLSESSPYQVDSTRMSLTLPHPTPRIDRFLWTTCFGPEGRVQSSTSG